jgi:curved DNA-binding protein CbpA
MDYFALFNEMRRPWLDPEVLKAKFLALSGKVHPDRLQEHPAHQPGPADPRFAELNAAYNTLRDPKLRLAHLLELERGGKPSDLQEIPPDLTELWMQIGLLCREVDAFLRQKQAARSPLLRVELFEQSQEWTEELSPVQQKLSGMQDALTAQLKREDNAWQDAPDPDRRAVVLARLEALYRLFGFTGRWAQQVQERIVLLSL